MSTGIHLTTLGHRIRHHRVSQGLTLDELGAKVGVAGSQLSLIENGKREPKLSLLQAIAQATGTEVPDLISAEPPNRRAALEIELENAQASPVFRQLGITPVRVSKGMPDETIEAILGLHRELQRREREAIATPEEARRANTELRLRMRAQSNYIGDIEKLAEKQLKAAGHVSGALTHRTVIIMAQQLGFELIYVNDLPHSTRSVTDLENSRIYLPPASIPGGHGLRSMALQAMAHRLLGHTPPTDYADFLQQRLEINYFAAACLIPETAGVAFLQQAKKERNLAVEDSNRKALYFVQLRIAVFHGEGALLLRLLQERDPRRLGDRTRRGEVIDLQPLLQEVGVVGRRRAPGGRCAIACSAIERRP